MDKVLKAHGAAGIFVSSVGIARRITDILYNCLVLNFSFST
jgi:hypothetical protein